MYWLYSTLLALGFFISLPYWLIQGLRHGKYGAGLRERLGKVPERLALQPSRRVIWVHAVSVGEVLAVSGLVAELPMQFPDHQVVISTTTDTGQKLARERFGEQNVCYFPLDFGFAIKPYLLRLRPELVVLAETEFWPNFLRLVHAGGAQIAVVNARISDRSWPGYRRWRWLLARILRAVDLFLAQTEEDGRRLAEIGVSPDRIRVTGNLKFDVVAPDPPPIVASLKIAFQQAGAAPVIVCGSTVEDEERLLLNAFEAVLGSYPRAMMIVAPRHPERFPEVAQLLEKSGVHSWRRSAWSGEPLAGGVLLLDSIGELAALYALGDFAFVGGSLVPRGGHNILEPAQHGVPILVGKHTENFRDVVKSFQSRDAVRVVAPEDLPRAFMELASNENKRQSLGRRAAETLLAHRGATQRTLDCLRELLQRRFPIPGREGGRATPPQ